MTKKERIIKQIKSDKHLVSRIDEWFFSIHEDIDEKIESFIDHSKDYIKAIKSGRMLCVITSVARSGMSRRMKFLSCEDYGKGKYSYRQYVSLFYALGYGGFKSSDESFRISGCGMDMVFHTNYCNIHDFKRLGIINDVQCRKLAQMTPTLL